MSKLREAIGFIGLGNMGMSICGGLVRERIVHPFQLFVFDLDKNKMKVGREINVCISNAEVVNRSRIIILAIKPQELKNVANEIKKELTKDKIIISILAGTPISKLRKFLGSKVIIVRAMPNLSAITGEAITAITSTSKRALSKTKIIFKACGKVVELKERFFDLVTAVSGSGPAYFFVLIEILFKFAKSKGLSEKEARLLAVQTALGAGTLAACSTELPEALRKRVTSKGGTTEAALKVLFKEKFPQIFERALQSAVKKSRELSRG